MTILIRQKMLGRNVSWIPSLDHAGIGTQIVVEKHLITKYKKKRYEIGKERFVEQIWEWKTEKEMEILRQLESLGCALDWDRLSFTLDKDFSDIVQEAFVFLFDKGFITRQPQIVNWCCDLKSAVSDLEVEHIHVSGVTEIKVPGHSNKIQFGQLYTVKYPLIDSLSGEVVLVSTTRPETILGDVALAIHPDDPRYSNLQGKRVMNPITKEIIPLVESSYVKQEFGTGVVKVTPGHDELDHRIATKLKLPTKLVMTDSGHITEGHGALSGLSRYDARKEVVALLLQNEMLHSIVDHPMSIPLCSRSGDVIEPMVKSLWTLNVESSAQECVRQVKEGHLRIEPTSYKGVWFEYLEKNTRDWCLSRQLWWGHRVPAYSCSTGTEYVWVAARNEDEAREKAASHFGVPKEKIISVKQDPDVLDTWFSSSFYPLVLSGWPKVQQTVEPISLMETGYDILFFWVARMVMMNILLQGRLPFKEVLLHGIILDKEGRKMSKSKGNVIDPLSIIKGDGQAQGMGADALRMALYSMNVKTQQMKFDVNTVVKYRNFCNKMLQATKLTSQLILHSSEPQPGVETEQSRTVHQWLRSRLYNAITASDAALKDFNFHLSLNHLFDLFYYDVCDVYLEVLKLLKKEDECIFTQSRTLYECLVGFSRSFHPLAPFVTEDLYHWLHDVCSIALPYESLPLAPYPKPKEWEIYANEKLENDVQESFDIADSVSQFKALGDISLKKDFERL